ncbi:hypothetical protein ACFYVL_28185 [Streptomyces sp. NPDC004111]|uniref:hypothetical protein n=1 Tax=Streptomyces sp. NPDC004111 TaxID=3364690 RepID=UPI00367F29DC
MCEKTATPPPRISLMASAELRDALTAVEEGKGATAVAALMSIDADSWQAIENRLVPLLGGDLRSLLLAAAERSNTEPPAIV